MVAALPQASTEMEGMKVCSPVPPSMTPCCRSVGLDEGKLFVSTSNHCTLFRVKGKSDPVRAPHRDPLRQTAFIIRGHTGSKVFVVPI